MSPAEYSSSSKTRPSTKTGVAIKRRWGLYITGAEDWMSVPHVVGVEVVDAVGVVAGRDRSTHDLVADQAVPSV